VSAEVLASLEQRLLLRIIRGEHLNRPECGGLAGACALAEMERRGIITRDDNAGGGWSTQWTEDEATRGYRDEA
jgi:hypothetical protein